MPEWLSSFVLSTQGQSGTSLGRVWPVWGQSGIGQGQSKASQGQSRTSLERVGPVWVQSGQVCGQSGVGQSQSRASQGQSEDKSGACEASLGQFGASLQWVKANLAPVRATRAPQEAQDCNNLIRVEAQNFKSTYRVACDSRESFEHAKVIASPWRIR